MVDQVEASRLAALTPRQRAQKLAAQAKEFLDRGLLLESERLYLSAVAADSTVAAAHAGLAEVRERSGDTVAARKEAHMAIDLDPTADALLILARLDFAAGHLANAHSEAAKAQQLAPQNRAALDLIRQIDAQEAQKR
jgi:tetratricopeptide (TPR) repeat protein